MICLKEDILRENTRLYYTKDFFDAIMKKTRMEDYAMIFPKVHQMKKNEGLYSLKESYTGLSLLDFYNKIKFVVSDIRSFVHNAFNGHIFA